MRHKPTPEEKKARDLAWRQKNKERLNQQSLARYHSLTAEKKTAHTSRTVEKGREWRKENPLKAFILDKRNGAKRCGIEFTLTLDTLPPVPDVCPVLGIPMELTVGQGTAASANSASLDRHDNTRGYIPGNVFWISWRANRLKSDATFEEITLLYEYMKHRTTADDK